MLWSMLGHPNEGTGHKYEDVPSLTTSMQPPTALFARTVVFFGINLKLREPNTP